MSHPSNSGDDWETDITYIERIHTANDAHLQAAHRNKKEKDHREIRPLD